jgi:hypothetical protein
MKTLSHEELFKFAANDNSIIVIKSDGKHSYIVLVESFYGGHFIAKNVFVFFADSKEGVNEKIQWFTDGNTDDILPSYLETVSKLANKPIDEIKESAGHTKSYGKIIGIYRNMNHDEFVEKHKDDFVGKMPQ